MTTGKTAERRASVQRLSQQDPTRSARSIAAELGVSKDTVRRDLEHLATTSTAPTEGQTPAQSPAPEQKPLAARTTHVHDTMRQLKEAVARVEAARPAYTLVADEVAHDWAAQLRHASEMLRHLRQQFADYYPTAITPGATQSRRRTEPAHPTPTPVNRDTDPAPPPLRLRTQPPPDEAA
ncbi:HTH domain-containing protein [Streptomyces niveus]